MSARILTFFVLLAALSHADEPALDMLGDPLPPGAVQRLGTDRMLYERIGGFCYLADGRAAVATGSRIEILDLTNGARLAVREIPGTFLRSPSCAGNGQWVLAADTGNNVVIVWDVGEKRALRQWPTGQSNLVSLCVSPDGQRVLTAGRFPPTLKEWDLADGRPRFSIAGSTEGFSIAIYGPAGNTALVGDTRSWLLHYDLATGALRRQWSSGDIYPCKLALSPDEKRLLVGSRDRATEWRLEDYVELRQYTGHEGSEATSVAYGSNPDEIFTGARDGSIRHWNRLEASVRRRWIAHPSGQVSAMQVSPDGRWVLSHGGGLLIESDIQTGRPRLSWERHNGVVSGVAFLTSGRIVSVSPDATIRFWDVSTGQCVLSTNTLSPLGAYAVAVSPDGKRMTVAGHNQAWEFGTEDGRMIRTLGPFLGFVRTVAYTPDGKRLLSAGDNGTIAVWKADSKEPMARLTGHQGGILCLAVSGDGKRLLSGGRDCTMRLWDLTTGTLLRTFEGQRGWVEGVAFLGGEKQGLSTGRDGRVLRWNLQKDAEPPGNGSWFMGARAGRCPGRTIRRFGRG